MALLETLTDNFDGSTLDSAKWSAYTYSGATVSVDNGHLTCVTGLGQATAVSVDSYTIASTSFLSAHIERAVASDYSIRLMVTNQADGLISGGAAYFEINSGNLECWTYNNVSSGGKWNTGTYVPSGHRWLRLKFTVTGNNIATAFQYSSDGLTWLTTYSDPARTWNSPTGYVRLYTYYGPGTTSKTTYFDRVNMTPIDSRFSSGVIDRPLATWTRDGWTSTFAPRPSGIWTRDGWETSWVHRPTAREVKESIPNSIVDAETFGAPQAAVALPSYPDGIAEVEAFGEPILEQPVPVGPEGIADPEIVGEPAIVPNFGSTPDTIVDPETLGEPKISVGYATTPVEIGDPEALGEPAIAFVASVTPDSLGDYDALGAPSLSIGTEASPDSIADPEVIGAPWAGTKITVQPDGLRDDGAFGLPSLLFTKIAAPSSLADIETLEGATITGPPIVGTPAEIADLEAFGGPALTIAPAHLPVEITDPETLDGPAVEFIVPPPFPDGIADSEAVGEPALRFEASEIGPASIVEPQHLGDPSLLLTLHYNGAYSTGDYGVGLYQGMSFTPDSIIERGLLGEPAILTVPVVGPNTLLPLGIEDPEWLGLPVAPRLDATNYFYGAGIYNEGPYYGVPGGATDENPQANLEYGSGTYGYGIYYGTAIPADPEDSLPLFRDIAGGAKPALHIIGIGPWSPLIVWRGVPNLGLPSGPRAARPALALPPATSKGFTLRLGEGGEARCDLHFARGSAIVIDEMDTDLWWRRKDPRTGVLEMIGRFNTAHVNLSTSDTGISCSVQFEDYQTVLGARLVLKYLNPSADPPTTMWNKGTPVTAILAWALPDNAGVDLSAVTGPTANLGVTIQPYHLPPGTMISDLMANLQSISSVPWEWWVETPLDVNESPRLEFAQRRGSDKGVILFDFGKGPTPIASWTKTGATDDYANSLYYTGGGTGTGAEAGGGVVEQLDADVQQYGQRDAQDGNFSIGGDIKAIRTRAHAKLQQLADRRPAFSVRLRQGFWRGRGHIDVGDTITLLLRLGKEQIKETYRVSEITVDIDENNLEEVGLSLGRLPVSADPRSKRSPLPRILRYLKNYSPPPGAIDIPDKD